MANQNLLRQFQVTDDEVNAAFEATSFQNLFGDTSDENDIWGSFQIGQIYDGTISLVEQDWVLIDIGYKSEGFVRIEQWQSERPHVGDVVRVLLERFDDQDDGLVLNRLKAALHDRWQQVLSETNEGDVVTGEVKRTIKGGLLVEMKGVNTFLPASQIDLRRPHDLREFIDKTLVCQVLKIDPARPNLVLSRRVLLEAEQVHAKQRVLDELQVGQVRKGVVKNIVSFGAFVDLGGIDGLLHVSDMSWDRHTQPNEFVTLNDEIEVQVLDFDPSAERISLGTKQLQSDPWSNIEERFPVGSSHRGQVSHVVNYGAFVALDEGVEGLSRMPQCRLARESPQVIGLVHRSELSWTRMVRDATSVLSADEEVDVVVLSIDSHKKQIALSVKRATSNPWEGEFAERYARGQTVDGRVTNVTKFGAFIQLEEGLEGLLHESQFVEPVSAGQEITVTVLEFDPANHKIKLTCRDDATSQQRLRGGLD